jgi:hypothetical protein
MVMVVWVSMIKVCSSFGLLVAEIVQNLVIEVACGNGGRVLSGGCEEIRGGYRMVKSLLDSVGVEKKKIKKKIKNKKEYFNGEEEKNKKKKCWREFYKSDS